MQCRAVQCSSQSGKSGSQQARITQWIVDCGHDAIKGRSSLLTPASLKPQASRAPTVTALPCLPAYLPTYLSRVPKLLVPARLHPLAPHIYGLYSCLASLPNSYLNSCLNLNHSCHHCQLLSYSDVSGRLQVRRIASGLRVLRSGVLGLACPDAPSYVSGMPRL